MEFVLAKVLPDDDNVANDNDYAARNMLLITFDSHLPLSLSFAAYLTPSHRLDYEIFAKALGKLIVPSSGSP